MRFLENMQDRPRGLLSWLVGVLVTAAAIIAVAVVALPVIGLLVGIGVVTIALIALVASYYYLRWRIRGWFGRRRAGDIDDEDEEEEEEEEDDDWPSRRPRKRLDVRIIHTKRRR